MKREALSRQVLARHEAGHLVALAMLDAPGDFYWRRLTGYEIAHVAERQAEVQRWEEASARDALIAKRAVVALAGGAAERAASSVAAGPADDLAVIHAWTGSVDFELAHEWLTLQRYDGDQAAIVADIVRLFGEVSAVLARPTQQRAIAEIAIRIEARLATADQQGRSALSFPAMEVLAGIMLDPPPRFMLKETVRTGGHPV